MCLTPIYVKGSAFPCRKCIECRIQYSEEWARRCMLESRKHSQNCFITLTYNEDNLPEGASVKKRDFQLFMKRLRKQLERFAIKVRYFACGEYGSKFDRPHYHAIIFGWFPDDAVFFRYDNKKNPLYRSKLLESVWKFGFSSVGVLTVDSAKYCAKYMQGDLPIGDTREQPFTLSSRRPGIALDVIPESVYKTGDIYYDGKKYTAPRSFLKKVKEQFPEYYDNFISYSKSPKSAKYKTDNKIIYDATYGEYTRQESFNKNLDIETRKKKFSKIFGNSLDKLFRPVIKLKHRKTMRKSD